MSFSDRTLVSITDLSANGSEFLLEWLAAEKMPLKSKQKKSRRHVPDVNRRKNSEGKLQAEREVQLLQQEIALAKVSELMAWLAHELNQPLSAILGNAQAALRLMERGAPDLKELREIFEDIVADDRRAAEVIRSLRSRIDRGAAERKPLQLNDLIREIMPVVQSESLWGDISVDLDLGLSLPSIAGDWPQLKQVMLNLIINAFEAIKHSERPGKLILRTRQAERELVLDVVDSGIGISQDKLNSIFDPFVSTKAGALGMGLALSRSIVIKHNGRLWAENNVDGGATFHVALPVEILGPAPIMDAVRSARSDAGQKPHGLTVLIADDRDTFRHAVSSILTKLPELKLLAEAADGAEAVKKAAELNPDLVLLDVGLPIVNGVEAAARIRSVAPDAKILFLTQHDSPEFVMAAMSAGALGYVLKVDVGRELLQAAMAVVRGERYLSAGIRR
jgi:signal transduction histidine kinase/CheY-like chemotaxis protein